MNIAQDIITRRVERGYNWLNTEVPGWQRKVNVHKLQPHSRYNCVVGQVLGDWYALYDIYTKPHWFCVSRGFLRAPGLYGNDGRVYDVALIDAWM
jgi:hypothetical protein